MEQKNSRAAIQPIRSLMRVAGVVLLVVGLASSILGADALPAREEAAPEAIQPAASSGSTSLQIPILMTRNESREADELAAPSRHCTTVGNTTICVCGNGGECIEVVPKAPGKAIWLCGC